MGRLRSVNNTARPRNTGWKDRETATEKGQRRRKDSDRGPAWHVARTTRAYRTRGHLDAACRPRRHNNGSVYHQGGQFYRLGAVTAARSRTSARAGRSVSAPLQRSALTDGERRRVHVCHTPGRVRVVNDRGWSPQWAHYFLPARGRTEGSTSPLVATRQATAERFQPRGMGPGRGSTRSSEFQAQICRGDSERGSATARDFSGDDVERRDAA